MAFSFPRACVFSGALSERCQSVLGGGFLIYILSIQRCGVNSVMSPTIVFSLYGSLGFKPAVCLPRFFCWHGGFTPCV